MVDTQRQRYKYSAKFVLIFRPELKSPGRMGSLGSSASTSLLWDREFETILIDLDDTLYHNPEIPVLVRANIEGYMVKKLGIPADQVKQLTQQLYYTHGTTMAGLAAQGYAIDFDDFHADVHGTLDYQNLLGPQPGTRQTLADLNLQKHILTNADAKHTAACLSRMGLTDCFQSIWCFENVMETARSRGWLTPDCPVLCKPNKQTFELVMDHVGASPSSTIFIDDSQRNVAAAHEMGIFSVLVSPTLAAQSAPHQQVAKADLVVASFNQLREVLPQIFVAAQPRLSEDVPTAAGVPVSVMAS